MQLTINLILDAQRIIMIVSVVYLVLFFALGSGLFNSIIEGASRGTRTFVVPTRSIHPKNQGGLLIAGFATIGIAMLLGFRLVDIKV